MGQQCNSCCNNRLPIEATPFTPISRNTEHVIQDNRFYDELLGKYEIVRPCLNTHVGQSEAFIFKLKEEKK